LATAGAGLAGAGLAGLASLVAPPWAGPVPRRAPAQEARYRNRID
jgi:hypothetical protein